MKNDSVIFYVLIGLSIAAVAGSILTLNFFVMALTSVFVLAAVVIYKMWYLIEALVFKHTNLVEIFNGYELSGDRLSAIRRIDSAVSATTAAALDVGKKTDIDNSKIENIIAHVNYPFKFILQVHRLNLERLLDGLQTKRNMKEMELSRLDQSTKKNSARINHVKREIEVIEHDIVGLTSGEHPLKLAYYVMTSAVSENTYDAEERAKSQIRELSSQFDVLLSAKSRVLAGEELVRLLELDSSMVID